MTDSRHSDASPADNTRVVLRRCVAYTIDVSIIAVALAIVIWVTGDVRRAHQLRSDPRRTSCFAYNNQALVVNSSALVVFGISAVVMVVVVFIVPQSIAGTSIGKALLGIRVVRRDGSPPGAVRSTLRLLCWAVDGSCAPPTDRVVVGDLSARDTDGSGTSPPEPSWCGTAPLGEPVRYSPVPGATNDRAHPGRRRRGGR